MSNSVQTKFLDVLSRHFPLPTGMAENPEAWEDDYVRILSSFSGEVLTEAADYILRERQKKSYPLPGECRTICLMCSDNQAAKLAKRDIRKVRKDDLDIEQTDTLFTSHWGNRAVQDGIELALWDWMAKHGRWPNEIEYEKILKSGKASAAAWEESIKGMQESGGLSAFLRPAINARNNRSARLRQLLGASEKSHAV